MKIINWIEITKYNRHEFQKWWEENKDDFDWSMSYIPCIYYFKHFEIWWDSDKFDYAHSDVLCKFCTEYFEIWYDPDKFEWGWSKELEQYCQNYKHLWEKDYFIYKLKKK